MPKKIKKIFFVFLCLLLIFQQAGFAQVAAELNIAGHLAALHNSFLSNTFRPLHLRYLSFNPIDNNFKLLLDKGSLNNPSNREIQDTSKTLMQYFLIGLTLPNDTFWVNLRPDSPDQIIDDRLAQTDIGKVMLETDLQLKKDTASFTSPQTPEGKEYWDKLYKKAEELYGYENITIPTLTRPWIVPGEIIIRETADSAYIYKATLKVMLEQDYLKNTQNVINVGATDYSFKDQRSKALNEYSAQLIRELIIPKLTKEVNSSKRYAPLRQVYYSFIMAQWFKARYKKGLSPDGVVPGLIDKQDLANLNSKSPWDKDTYFQAYKKSFTEGEYSIQEPVYTPTGQVIRSYFSGGEVLTGVSSAMVVIPSSSHSPVLASSSLMAIDYPSFSSSSLKEVLSPAAGSAIKKGLFQDTYKGKDYMFLARERIVGAFRDILQRDPDEKEVSDIIKLAEGKDYPEDNYFAIAKDYARTLAWRNKESAESPVKGDKGDGSNLAATPPGAGSGTIIESKRKTIHVSLNATEHNKLPLLMDIYPDPSKINDESLEIDLVNPRNNQTVRLVSNAVHPVFNNLFFTVYIGDRETGTVGLNLSGNTDVYSIHSFFPYDGVKAGDMEKQGYATTIVAALAHFAKHYGKKLEINATRSPALLRAFVKNSKPDMGLEFRHRFSHYPAPSYLFDGSQIPGNVSAISEDGRFHYRFFLNGEGPGDYRVEEAYLTDENGVSQLEAYKMGDTDQWIVHVDEEGSITSLGNDKARLIWPDERTRVKVNGYAFGVAPRYPEPCINIDKAVINVHNGKNSDGFGLAGAPPAAGSAVSPKASSSLKLGLGLVLKNRISQKQRLALQQLLKLDLEQLEPAPPVVTVGQQGLIAADEILRKNNAVGIVIGSTAKDLHNRLNKDDDLKKHKDIDVVVLSDNFKLSGTFEGGIDWWVPEKVVLNIKTIGGSAENHEETIYVNGNGIFLRSGKISVGYSTSKNLEPGLYLPSRDTLIDLTLNSALALVDSSVEVDTDVEDAFRDRLEKGIGNSISPVWKNSIGKEILEDLRIESNLDKDTVRAIIGQTPYKDIGDRYNHAVSLEEKSLKAKAGKGSIPPEETPPSAAGSAISPKGSSAVNNEALFKETLINLSQRNISPQIRNMINSLLRNPKPLTLAAEEKINDLLNNPGQLKEWALTVFEKLKIDSTEANTLIAELYLNLWIVMRTKLTSKVITDGMFKHMSGFIITHAGLVTGHEMRAGLKIGVENIRELLWRKDGYLFIFGMAHELGHGMVNFIQYEEIKDGVPKDGFLSRQYLDEPLSDLAMLALLEEMNQKERITEVIKHYKYGESYGAHSTRNDLGRLIPPPFYWSSGRPRDDGFSFSRLFNNALSIARGERGFGNGKFTADVFFEMLEQLTKYKSLPPFIEKYMNYATGQEKEVIIMYERKRYIADREGWKIAESRTGILRDMSNEGKRYFISRIEEMIGKGDLELKRVYGIVNTNTQATYGEKSDGDIVPPASSPLKEENFGGIDFRSLPIVTQATANLSAGISNPELLRLSAVNLDDEWQAIERMSSSGIKPSSERIKEYAQASSVLDKISRDRDRIILCIADILRQEEEQNCETDPVLRDILVALESIQRTRELKEVFLGKV